MFAKLVKKADGSQKLVVSEDKKGPTFVQVEDDRISALKSVFTLAKKADSKYAYLNDNLAEGEVHMTSKNAYFAKSIKALHVTPANAPKPKSAPKPKATSKPAPKSKKAARKPKAAPKQPALVMADMSPRQTFALELCNEFGWTVA